MLAFLAEQQRDRLLGQRPRGKHQVEGVRDSV